MSYLIWNYNSIIGLIILFYNIVDCLIFGKTYVNNLVIIYIHQVLYY